MNHAPTVQRNVIDIPGHPSLKLHVYGKTKAGTVTESQEQAYFVSQDGLAVPMGELPSSQKEQVISILKDQYPEHALI